MECLRCGHSWESRKLTKPKSCPACKSYRWQTPAKTPKQIADEVNSEVASKEVRDIIREIDGKAYRASIAAEKPAEPAESWEGWSEERKAPDHEAGETVTYRQHLGSGRRRIIKRESF